MNIEIIWICWEIVRPLTFVWNSVLNNFYFECFLIQFVFLAYFGRFLIQFVFLAVSSAKLNLLFHFSTV